MFFALYYSSSTPWQGIHLLSSGQFSIFACYIPQQQGFFYWNDAFCNWGRSSASGSEWPPGDVEGCFVCCLNASREAAKKFTRHRKQTWENYNSVGGGCGRQIRRLLFIWCVQRKESKYYYSCTFISNTGKLCCLWSFLTYQCLASLYIGPLTKILISI